MKTLQVIKRVPLDDFSSGAVVNRFTRYSVMATMAAMLLLSGCATTGGPNMQVESSPGVVVSEAQASDATPKAAEEYVAGSARCGVVGAVIGGAIGIAAAVPVCTNFSTSVLCPETVVLFGGGMAIIGNAVGERMCREYIHEP